jgi:Carboxypeptidase regulatory-like domain
MLAKAIMILLVITLSAPWASAQSTFGDVVGVVKDQNQGGVPGAQIVITSVDDGSQHQTMSDADGAFHFVNLKADNYDLVATAAGFADFKISSAHLDARQTLRF